MTLLDRWDDYGIWDEKEVRRALAIAQAVEEKATDEIVVEVKRQIMRRADELLEGK